MPNTCYNCAKRFCNRCEDETGSLNFCYISTKSYCSDCAPASSWEYCDGGCGECMWRKECRGLECNECGLQKICFLFPKCEYCRTYYCEDCAADMNVQCESCERVICEDCSDGDINSVKHCDDCCRTFCYSCRAGDCKMEGKGKC